MYGKVFLLLVIRDIWILCQNLTVKLSILIDLPLCYTCTVLYWWHSIIKFELSSVLNNLYLNNILYVVLNLMNYSCICLFTHLFIVFSQLACLKHWKWFLVAYIAIGCKIGGLIELINIDHVVQMLKSILFMMQ